MVVRTRDRGVAPAPDALASAARAASAALAAAQAAFALRALAPEPRRGTLPTADGLELAGDALALPAADERAPAQLLRLAAEATGARSAALWRERLGEIELVSSYGAEE